MASNSNIAAPIRQPRGPSEHSFGTAPAEPAGPPVPDSEALLKRNNTISTPRHHVSVSISSASQASTAFHGARQSYTTSRFRSGSLSSSGPDPGLVRKTSGRAVQDVVTEGGEEGTTESGTWGRGLSRQSSLPSRKGINAFVSQTSEPVPPLPHVNPPARPPRRMAAIGSQDFTRMAAPVQSHASSHSLSSLTMLSPPGSQAVFEASTPASVSRTQSLRAQAKLGSTSTLLGRSSSLKSTADHRVSSSSPQTQHSTPQELFTPPSPPPVSSSAAMPPFRIAFPNDRNSTQGSDLKRHQSLTQGYGSNTRVKERLERSPTVLSVQQRPLQLRSPSPRDEIEPPTSPIGHSVWSPAQVGDDGWSRPVATPQIQEAFQAMHLGAALPIPPPSANVESEPYFHAGPQHIADEPTWVTNLVGQPERRSPAPHFRPDTAPSLQNQFSYLPMRNPRLGNEQYLGLPFGFQPSPQLQTPGGYGFQPLQRYPASGPHDNYTTAPSYQAHHPYPTTPAPPSANDMEVIELARSKGLNPATFDCRPVQARFFVIKSYTEDDVQKSLKHEIWSSTVLGNKRLDSAFRESADHMPIYLFFSVNGSRHFCGVAQMLTPVDESQTSTVWAQNKWKGIFKVKWIFVRDVPSTAFRHIRLINTPEQKPMTNSRDTQELHYEAGCEVLQIFLDHQNKSKTSLLQDFAYYERLSSQRISPTVS